MGKGEKGGVGGLGVVVWLAGRGGGRREGGRERGGGGREGEVPRRWRVCGECWGGRRCRLVGEEEGRQGRQGREQSQVEIFHFSKSLSDLGEEGGERWLGERERGLLRLFCCGGGAFLKLVSNYELVCCCCFMLFYVVVV